MMVYKSPYDVSEMGIEFKYYRSFVYILMISDMFEQINESYLSLPHFIICILEPSIGHPHM